MAGAFDDLLPPAAAPAQSPSGAFADLMPPPEPVPVAAAAPPVDPLDQVRELMGAQTPAQSVRSAAAAPVYSGSILPFSRYADGTIAFDPKAGLLAPFAKAAAIAPAALTGQIDPMDPSVIHSAADMALAASPMSAGAGPALKAGVAVAPTAKDLLAAGGQGFDTARNLGVDYSIPHIANWASSLQQDLYGKGFLPTEGIAPGTHALLQQLQRPSSDAVAVPLSALIAARQGLNHIAAGPDGAAASIARQSLDSFIASPPAGSVLAGPSESAASILKDANGNYAAGARSDAINGIERSADLRSSANNSGKNIGNTTRGKVTSLLESDARSRGFDDNEIAALEGVVHGSQLSNAFRTAANKLGGGGGLGSTVATLAGGTLGALFGGETGAVIGSGAAHGVGPALKAVQNGMDTKALSAVDQQIRQRSPLFENAPPPAPVPGVSAGLGPVGPIVAPGLAPGIAQSVSNADPNSRAAAIAKTLAGSWAAPPPAKSQLGSVFDQGGTI